jgi:hypothetical protein
MTDHSATILVSVIGGTFAIVAAVTAAIISKRRSEGHEREMGDSVISNNQGSGITAHTVNINNHPPGGGGRPPKRRRIPVLAIVGVVIAAIGVVVALLAWKRPVAPPTPALPPVADNAPTKDIAAPALPSPSSTCEPPPKAGPILRARCASLTTREFSESDNGVGRPWRYGWKDTVDGQFHPYTCYRSKPAGVLQGDPGLHAWSQAAWPAMASMIGMNTHQVTIHGSPSPPIFLPKGSFAVEPGQSIFHPGPKDEYATARWTAPSGGQYKIKLKATGESGVDKEQLKASKATTDVHVQLDGLDIMNGVINSEGNANVFAPKEQTVTLQYGSTLDIMVGPGSDTFKDDSTGIEVDVCRVGK